MDFAVKLVFKNLIISFLPHDLGKGLLIARSNGVTIAVET